MRKGLFFCLPSISAAKTLTGLINEVAVSGYNIIYYNTKDFEPEGEFAFKFKAYSDDFRGYRADKIDVQISYFEFGEILIDSAMSLAEFLDSEIRNEKPDFIIYSHLAVWGKLIANRYKLPTITLFTTFVLDKRIMLPYFRKLNSGTSSSFYNVNNALNFYRKSDSLYKHLELNYKPELWDVYINKGDLNLSFILKLFQPQNDLFQDFHFLGYPMLAENNWNDKKVIYVSMGTVLNKNLLFYQLCINVLGQLGIESVISVGSVWNAEDLQNPYGHIKLVPFIDQRMLLNKAIVFLTRGGMASIHEAIYSCTPMIVIPIIPEQQLNAEKIEQAGIGIHLPCDKVNEASLKASIQKIISESSTYRNKIEGLIAEMPQIPAEKRGSSIIRNFLQNL